MLFFGRSSSAGCGGLALLLRRPHSLLRGRLFAVERDFKGIHLDPTGVQDDRAARGVAEGTHDGLRLRISRSQ